MRQNKEFWRPPVSSDGYVHVTGRRRSKTDWASTGIGDAFKTSQPYYHRLPAQRLFYQMIQNAQQRVARITGIKGEDDHHPKVKPQLAPCYSTYPATPAAMAAIGLTAFLEFKARVKPQVLSTHMKNYLENPAVADGVGIDSEVYKQVADTVVLWIETRLLMEDLSRDKDLYCIEIYRLFSASQENLRFTTLSEIVRATVIYGDVLPHPDTLKLHPMTRHILQDLTQASAPFFKRMNSKKGSAFIALGIKWVRTLCRVLSIYLPTSEESDTSRSRVSSMNNARTEEAFQGGHQRFDNDPHHENDSETFYPLDKPTPPMLHEPENAAAQIASLMPAGFMPDGSIGNTAKGDKEESGEASKFQESLVAFSKALSQAGSQDQAYQDIRWDLLEDQLRRSPFHPGPIEGQPTDGHEVSVKLDGDKEAGGEIYDHAVALSDDLPACEALSREAAPITRELRRNLYPNIEVRSVTRRFCTGGSLDPARLSLGNFKTTIYKRYRAREQANLRGRPVVVIACDGSGSLNSSQMKMLKLLTVAFLESTARTHMQVIAGLYHSGYIRPGVSGPLVQWIYHPRKTPAIGPRDAARAVASLPNSGTGVQSDALSIAYMLDEAGGLAKNAMIYLILISDTEWNRSFNLQKSGREEVYSIFVGYYRELAQKLHTTLVALGVDGQTGFEDLLDTVITVSEKELLDAAAVAEKIGVYVAKCIRQRNRMVA